MNGAFIVSDSPSLLDAFSGWISRAGGDLAADGSVARLKRNGFAFTLFKIDQVTDAAFEQDWRSGHTQTRADSAPDYATAMACWAECRSEDLFIDVLRRVAAEIAGRTWVLDGDGTPWLATEIDPQALVL